MQKPANELLRGIAWKSWLLLAGWLLCAYHTGNPPNNALVHKLYNKANRLFNTTSPTDATDSLSLITYQQVIDLSQKPGAVPDSMLFFAWLNKGILLDVQTHYQHAITAYQQAQYIKQRNPHWSDSLLYTVKEHAGSAWYRLYHFDSASHYLLQAEMLSQRFPGVPEKERLYNDLGVLYYEKGNYQQSRNYLTHALELISRNPEKDAAWMVNIENNIAAACYKLGLYQQAIAIYKTICSQKVFTSQIFLNMGLAYKAMHNYEQALHWFHQVNATTLPRVLNEIAHTHLQLDHTDSASAYFAAYKKKVAAGKVPANSIYFGMHHLYYGEQLVRQQQWSLALRSYQQAIIQFSGQFRNPDPFTNPTQFTGSFTSYRLFDALQQKATAFEMLFKQQRTEKHLQAALNTCNSAISLLRYIEKSYDTDEAKLFLKRHLQQISHQAVSICMQLEALYPGSGYAQQAFIIAERNKASVMYSGVTEKNLRKLPGINPALVQQERNIKFNLARLSIQSDQTPDSTTQAGLAKEKAGYEIQLAQVQRAIEQYSVYYQLKYSDTFPQPAAIQRNLTPQQVVISCYIAGNCLNLFAITNNQFKHTTVVGFDTLQYSVQQWLALLQNTGNGERFAGKRWSAQLYKQLVQPLQTLAGDKSEWIIIPDGILYYLPFESLPTSASANSDPLLLTTEISYQFSSRFITAPERNSSRSTGTYTTLAMAPFTNGNMVFPNRQYPILQQLPASAREIALLTGLNLTASAATKTQFLQHLQHYPVIHLATHAIADTGNSAASFIAFYPHLNQPAQSALYLEELNELQMENNQLLILSACETGTGRLVNSEGVLSITRGFAYAGCTSIINSLWKADDEATATILQQFHTYLQKGYSKSKALRQAKLHYLRSNTLHKTPGYWAHLVLTGDASPLVQASLANRWLPEAPRMVAGVTGIVFTAMLGRMFLFKRRKKST